MRLHFDMVFHRNKPSLTGDRDYEEYVSTVTHVAWLNDQREPVATLTEADDKAAFDAVLNGVQTAQPSALRQVAVVDKGEDPKTTPPLTVDWSRFVQVVNVEEAFFDALIDGNDDEIHRLQFERFKMTKAYADQPCEESFFKGLRAEYEQSRYLSGMDFSQYYAWLHRSARENLGEDGQLSEPCKTTLQQMLTAWSSMKAEEVQQNANRNLQVHPRHRALVNAFLDQERGHPEDLTPSPADAPSGARSRTRRLG